MPPALLNRDLNEYGFTIDGWCRKDMPSDFTDYFDLRVCPSRDTGYDGSRVWKFIHSKICFSKRLDEPGNSWKRDYNRAVSGMHAAVHAEIIADIGHTEVGRAEYHRRLRDHPGAVTNLYFAYMLTLCALRECRNLLDNCSYLGDDEFIQPLMQQLTAAELLGNDAVQRAASNLRSHAASPTAEVWRMRMRHRDLKQMMGCVQCSVCQVHGTVMCLGLGATLQVLLGSDGRGGDPLDLDRLQIAALITTAAKFGAACETVEHFRELDVEEEAKAAWLAKKPWPDHLAPQARLGAPVFSPEASDLPSAIALEANADTADSPTVSDEEAKRAWLARLDAPTWGVAAKAASQAMDMSTIQAVAEGGMDEAPETLSEEEAKRAWLARLDAPTWPLSSRYRLEGDTTESVEVAMVSEAQPLALSASEEADEAECNLDMIGGPPTTVDCDVVIVGGGPAGCSCALYTSRANLKTVLLDKNAAFGALAITSHIANYPYVRTPSRP